jgi:L-rhamnose mutarotase
MRIALHSVLHEGHEDAYDAAHRRIPDALAALFAQVGIHDWVIWRSGADLFHLVDCDDFDQAMGALAAHPVNLAWQATINEHVDHFFPPGPELVGLPQVWQLSEQLATTNDWETS